MKSEIVSIKTKFEVCEKCNIHIEFDIKPNTDKVSSFSTFPCYCPKCGNVNEVKIDGIILQNGYIVEYASEYFQRTVEAYWINGKI